MQCREASDPIEIFQSKLDRRQYYEAFLYWPVVEPEYRAIPEGAVGQAFGDLISRTAATGKDDWFDIFTDQSIDVSLKRALFDEIIEGDEWNNK